MNHNYLYSIVKKWIKKINFICNIFLLPLKPNVFVEKYCFKLIYENTENSIKNATFYQYLLYVQYPLLIFRTK